MLVISELSIQEREFLMVVTRMALTPRRASQWDEYLGDSQVTCQVLLSRGVMAEASTTEKITAGYRVQDFKAMLRERGLKVSGRKEDLVTRLMGAMTDQEAYDVAKSVIYFKLTPDGQQVIDAHLEEKASEQLKAEERALAYLRSCDFESAKSEIVRFKYAYHRVFWQKKSGGCDAGDLLSPAGPEDQVYYLLNTPVEDLVLGDNERTKVAETLAIGKLVGDGHEDVALRLLAITGENFPCTSLIEFLSSDPCGGYAKRFKPDNPRDLAELYCHTKNFQASNECALREMLEKPWVTGVEILVPLQKGTHKDYYDYC
jgi:SAP domain